MPARQVRPFGGIAVGDEPVTAEDAQWRVASAALRAALQQDLAAATDLRRRSRSGCRLPALIRIYREGSRVAVIKAPPPQRVEVLASAITGFSADLVTLISDLPPESLLSLSPTLLATAHHPIGLMDVAVAPYRADRRGNVDLLTETENMDHLDIDIYQFEGPAVQIINRAFHSDPIERQLLNDESMPQELRDLVSPFGPVPVSDGSRDHLDIGVAEMMLGRWPQMSLQLVAEADSARLQRIAGSTVPGLVEHRSPLTREQPSID